MYARDTHFIQNHTALISDRKAVEEMRVNIQQGDTYIAKSVIPRRKLNQIREYLINIGRNSLPNFYPIKEGCPNFHRLNQNDSRSYVMGCFHQFVFFPWNQDIFNFFHLFREIYHLKNILSNLPKEKFIGIKPEKGCIARLAFQFYPRGAGFLNKHMDPVDYHQLVIPVMQLSKKGEDFKKGGAYVERKSGERLILDDISEWGDVIYTNAQINHGVEAIDPGLEVDWRLFSGRWMLLFAVNKLAGNCNIADAKDLGSQ